MPLPVWLAIIGIVVTILSTVVKILAQLYQDRLRAWLEPTPPLKDFARQLKKAIKRHKTVYLQLLFTPEGEWSKDITFEQIRLAYAELRAIQEFEVGLSGILWLCMVRALFFVFVGGLSTELVAISTKVANYLPNQATIGAAQLFVWVGLAFMAESILLTFMMIRQDWRLGMVRDVLVAVLTKYETQQMKAVSDKRAAEATPTEPKKT